MPDEDVGIRSNGHSHPDPQLVTETDYSPPRGSPFPIIGIGASAGGLESFAQLLAAVPDNTGAAFVLVQHLDPQHESLLGDLLSPSTPMPVVTVHDGMQVEPDHVYVIPPNSSMELQDGTLRLVTREPGLHLPIDIFFRSLAQVQGSRAVGVVLSGNASDGSLGVRAIKAECGLTFAQDEATARFGGMPRNAIATGAVDFIMSPADIGRELGRLGQHPFLITPQPGVAEAEILPEGDGEFGRVLATLQTATKVDFSQYKPTTIRRRIGRRMMIVRVETLAEYARYLQQKPSELFELYKDLLISVTSFFRDPPAFEALARHLQNSLAAREDRKGALRVWVPGCATGEEVYSLAMRLHEFLLERQLAMPLQLFGTDISETALQRARQGSYSGIIADDVSEERLRRFFTKTETGYQISKMIREACVFARHDVTKDPPFSRLDIVSCRNVLIYLDNRAQRKVLPTFHYALNPTGLLMLGSAETTAAAADLFNVLDKAHHIYSRKPVATRLMLELAAGPLSADPIHAVHPDTPSGLELQKRLERVIQTRYSPDAVVVSPEMQILQFRGHTAPYLDPTPGEATLNLLRMARESLVMPLRRALQRAVESDIVAREPVSVEIDGRLEEVSLEVTPVTGASAAERCFLIVFVRSNALPATPAADGVEVGETFPEPPGETAAALERELAETREYLRHLTEQYEAHAEELRAANEEARSANEELQSTNEELGTTKEELQSANEELTTVNEELQHRNQELAAANSDMRNLLASVTVAIVMVDQDLRVRRFNSAAEKLLELGPLDIGRPVGHLRGRIETPRLEGQVKRVIESLSPIAEELQDVDGCWYAVGVRPYRTLDDRIAGGVITFQEIDALKRGLAASEEARQYAEALIETVREPLVVLDADLRVQRATPAFYETFLVSREETEGRMLYDLGSGQWNRPRLRELLGSALFRSEPFHDFEIEHEFPHIGRRTMRLNARRIPRRDPQQRTLLLAIEDVTERQEIAEIRFQRLFETAKDAIVVIDAETEVIEDANPFFFTFTGFRREDVVGSTASDAGRRLAFPEMSEIVAETQQSEIVRRDDVKLVCRAGEAASIDVVANRYRVGTQPVVQLNIRDIASRKQAALALRESENRFRVVVESVRDYAIFQLDAEGRIVTWNTGAERLLGWHESEIVGKGAEVVFTPEDVARGEHRKELEKARLEGRAEDERWHMRKDGSRFFASGVLTRVMAEDGSGLAFTKIMQDVTNRKEQEQRLHQSVEEKSILLREIHHRVKNNLQVIVSLLSLQATHTEDPQVLAAFEETKGRVRAIAQIHEQLYATDDLSEVEVGSYLGALARELVALHATAPGGVRLHVEVPEMVLPIEKAIPVGLIANELLLNSLKYGFPSGTGDLSFTLQVLPEDRVRLRVEDNGPGFPADFDPARSGSMGFRLVNLLVRQLRAHLELGSAPGATVTVTFPIGDLTPTKGGEQQDGSSRSDRRR
jgi:two-component system, chemotaxis family, CheB/CheR fusion protein